MPSAFQTGRSTKVEYTVLVDRSGSDNSKVASVGATVAGYLQGATARSATGSGIAVAGSGTIQVSHPGGIEVGDTVKNGASGTSIGTVTAITRGAGLDWTITVTASVGTLTWAQGDRFLVTSRRPTLYKDNGHKISWGGSSATSDANGRVVAYAQAAALDLVVSGGTPAATAAVVQDVMSTDQSCVINVRDFGGSIKDAMTLARQMPTFVGPVTIYVPAGIYSYDAADLAIALDIGVRIVGEGKLRTHIQLEGTAGNNNLDLFVVTHEHVSIEGMSLYGVGTVGTGRAIWVGVGTGNFSHFRARDLLIYNWSGCGIELGDQVNATGVDIVEIDDCRILDSQSTACVRIGSACTVILVKNCRIGKLSSMPTGVYAILLTAPANTTILNCDGNPADTSTSYLFVAPTNSFAHPQDGPANLVIEGCDFEHSSAPGAATTPLIYVQGASGVELRDTILYQFGSGAHFEDCYMPIVENVIVKALGGSGYELKFTDCFSPVVRSTMYETADGSTGWGSRRQIAVTYAGNNPGRSQYGAGIVIPTFANDLERDTAAGAGADSAAALTVAGTLIYVVGPTAPASHLQIRHGGAWIGIASWNGAAGAI